MHQLPRVSRVLLLRSGGRRPAGKPSASPDDGEVHLVGGQRQHDQVRVVADDAVPGVRVMPGLGAQPPHQPDQLVLALPWHRGG